MLEKTYTAGMSKGKLQNLAVWIIIFDNTSDKSVFFTYTFSQLYPSL